MRKSDQIGGIYVISGMLKIVWSLCIGTSRAFHKARLAIEKTFDPVFIFIRETIHLFEFVEHTYFEPFRPNK